MSCQSVQCKTTTALSNHAVLAVMHGGASTQQVSILVSSQLTHAKAQENPTARMCIQVMKPDPFGLCSTLGKALKESIEKDHSASPQGQLPCITASATA